jgi:peptide/nickel transport system permease protein
LLDTASSFARAKADIIETPLRRAWRRLLRRKGALLGLAVITLFIAMAVFAPLIARYDPTAQSYSLIRRPPSDQHWFGTDELGRDLLARIIYGARASLLAGVISV